MPSEKHPVPAQLPFGEVRNLLPGIFRNTSTSYKFFFYLALVDAVYKTDDLRIPIEDLVIDMVARVWYPVNFFRLSFGWQDQLANVVKKVQSVSGLPDDATEHQVKKGIKANLEEKEVKTAIRNLSLFVPYRLIRPWVNEDMPRVKDSQINNEIARLAREKFYPFEQGPPYHFKGDHLFMNINWVAYIKDNYKVLLDFGYWHLLQYLQKRNPNVPGLVSKLFRPESRALNSSRKYWKEYLSLHPQFTCIFSQQLILPQKFDLDHFLPWSFVAHDQLWNLIPIDKAVNSAKSNRLPALKHYLRSFSERQQDFFRFHFEKKHCKRLEDFAVFFQEEPENIYEWDREAFAKRMRSGILPQHEIATNMGFERNWRYRP